MAKIGRNTLCPCGSSKKFKHCHGSITSVQDNMTHLVTEARQRIEALRIQRERQQGEGRPIISAEFAGHRFVAVKNRLMYSKNWRTFHDFLFDYIKTAMGVEWGNAELTKSLEQRHPILVWYHYLCEYQRSFQIEIGKICEAPLTGAIAAYLNLAYDLFALEHNADLQKKLIGRLRNEDQFYAARYEVFVAATLIRAGFTLAFEDEDDRNSTHCEFTATFIRSGRQFSVEAKHRAGNRVGLGRQLNRALQKDAAHPRIVFIDVNVPDDVIDDDIPQYLSRALSSLREFEGRKIKGQALPNAYLIVTNTPWHHHLTAQNFRCAALAEGFQIPDFKIDNTFVNLRAAIDAREKNIEMFSLLRSMQDLKEVPSTFDGEIAEFAFGTDKGRLLIGERYLVKDAAGIEHPGLLTTATMVEAESMVYGGLSFEDGTAAIYTWPMSDAEMSAWRKHPDTFFGKVGQRNTNANDPLALYDFFLNEYKETPIARLLELMIDAPDIAQLRQLNQSELASIYAERSANAVIANHSA